MTVKESISRRANGSAPGEFAAVTVEGFNPTTKGWSVLKPIKGRATADKALDAARAIRLISCWARQNRPPWVTSKLEPKNKKTGNTGYRQSGI